MNNWQLCPKCNGTGTIELPIFQQVTVPQEMNADEILEAFKKTGQHVYHKLDDNICPVCQGKMIISVFTGKPPMA